MAKSTALSREVARLKSARTAATRRTRHSKDQAIKRASGILASYVVGMGERSGTLPPTMMGFDTKTVLGGLAAFVGPMVGGPAGEAITGAGWSVLDVQAYLQGLSACSSTQLAPGATASPTATSAGLSQSVLGDLATDNLLDVV